MSGGIYEVSILSLPVRVLRSNVPRSGCAGFGPHEKAMGSDTSKDTLDVYCLSKRKHKEFANVKMDLSTFTDGTLLIVFEATGG